MESTAQPVVTFVYFSYTKQTKSVVDAMAAVFSERGFEVRDGPIAFTDHRWAPRFSKFPLPMMKLVTMLFPQMRGATGEIGIPDAARQTDADLVVIGSPTWFFRTSVPLRSFMKTPEAAALLKDRPFAAVVVCRRYWSINMGWVRRRATKLGGQYVDSVHFRFQGGQVRSLASLISYLTTGETKDRYLGIRIPPSNLQPTDLDTARAFATSLADKHLATTKGATSAG